MANLLFSVPAFHAAYMQEFALNDKTMPAMHNIHATPDYMFALDGHTMLVSESVAWHADTYGASFSFRYTAEIVKALRNKKATSLEVYYDPDRKRTDFVVDGVGQFPADDASCDTSSGLLSTSIIPPNIKDFLSNMLPEVGAYCHPSAKLNPKNMAALVKMGKTFQIDFGKAPSDPMLVTWPDTPGLRAFVMPFVEP
ncbi:hypothetical protein EOL96_08235 [Candidatus Saccharibacteria bacterium]|nr:hypothetical protein [Candidatus Saccharibacteria bacterium]